MLFNNRPFKPPSLIRKSAEGADVEHEQSEPPQPQAKRRRIDPPAPKPSGVTNKTAVKIVLPSRLSDQEIEKRSAIEAYYNVLWRKPTNKKHKTWDGDGVLIVRDGYAELRDPKGRTMGRRPLLEPLLPGSTLSIAGKEVEVDSLTTRQDYLSSLPFKGASEKPTMKEVDQNLRTDVNFSSQPKAAQPKFVTTPAVPPLSQTAKMHEPARNTTSVLPVQNVLSRSADVPMASTQFKSPLLVQNILPKGDGDRPVPRHDPAAQGAVVMPRPGTVAPRREVVDVVVDPILSKYLREHQKEGVKFLYECIMGFKGMNENGAILADSMGLGKTLQIITLLWTLMKQNPIWNEPPVIKKALVVCPAGVVDNWRKEFRKWLGNERIGVFTYNDKDKRITDFTKGRAYNVMIIGYERLRISAEELSKGHKIDIVIMDEGHRLKTAKDKAAQAIKSLDIDKRIVLSGTVLQNNLSELYFVVDLVHPGLLGKASAFRRQFEEPIEQGREAEATEENKIRGAEREQELMELTSTFTLRRSGDILAQYLPPKTEYTLFCKPTSAQAAVYREVLRSPILGAVLGSFEAALQLISVLKKLCNSPVLLREANNTVPKSGNDSTSSANAETLLSSLLTSIPSKLLSSPGASGKLRVLDSLLHHLRISAPTEKVVIVSNYTSTLDILSNLLTSLSYPHYRLDGSTPSTKRQSLIDTFNRAPASKSFAFLLSAKSGGVGINLIGASRLILFDVDWNPATDLQAMARIHREGQKKHCRIYRLLTLGALDEKIYQRQLTKISLSDALVDGKVSASSFTRQELRRLFTLDESGKCQTHELLGCDCSGRGLPSADLKAAAVAAILDSEGDESVTERKTNASSFVAASELDVAHEPPAGPTKTLTLMSHKHVDCSLFWASSSPSAPESQDTSASDSIDVTDKPSEEELLGLLDEDEVLMQVLRESDARVRYIFSKTNGSEVESDAASPPSSSKAA